MKFFSLYKPNYIVSLVYMLQASEYELTNYLRWFWRVDDFDGVMYRRHLDYTRKATLLVISATLLRSIQYVGAAYLLSEAYDVSRLDFAVLGLGWLLLEPALTAHILVIPLSLGNVLIQQPKTEAMVNRARTIFANHPGATIAVAGSYGKTSTKEILATVLSQKLDVAATPANLNTPIALSKFAETLTGEEDVVIVELGEFTPGDIEEFAQLVSPDAAVITGLTEAHLDTLGDLETAAQNLLSLASYVPSDSLFISADSEKLAVFTTDVDHEPYGEKEVMGWKISKIKSSLEGTSFEMKKGKTTLQLTSQILGRHMVGVLALVAAIAKAYKIPKNKIEKGVAQTAPFEHRMQLMPNDDTVIIDDTYNGNIEGVKAAVSFVGSLKSTGKKIYVTPGLVEMGEKANELNNQLGQLVGNVFDEVYLMKNDQTAAIKKGLKKASFKGETKVVDDPLAFYGNLDSMTSTGDIVLMQNDLPDNYS